MLKDDGKYKLFLTCGVTLVLFCLYLPLLRNGFIINLDDHQYVIGNPIVSAGISAEGVVRAFTTTHSYNWHPLTWLSHMVDVQLYGFNPVGHHLSSILFHLANFLLLLALISRLTRRYWLSLCVAILFAVHPLHLESVAWVAERKDMLSTFFGLLAMHAYARYAAHPRIGSYLAVAALFACSLMSKAMLVTLPFLLLLLDYWPLQRLRFARAAQTDPSAPALSLPRLLAEKLPLLGLSVAASAVTYLVQKKEGALNVDTSFLMNSGNALVSYVKYLLRTFWPDPIAAIYPFRPETITVPMVTGAALILGMVSALALLQWKRRPYLIVGWLWYLATLVPVIGIIRVGDQALADRYTYVPLIGLFIVIVWGAAELIEAFAVPKKGAVALCCLVFLALSAVLVRSEGIWRDDVTLFRHAIAVTETNYKAHRYLGLAYGKLGDAGKAASERNISRVQYFGYLSRLRPGDWEIHYQLGNAHNDLGNYDDAIRHYLVSTGLNRGNSKAFNNLGVCYYQKGDVDLAIRAFRDAISVAPDNAEAIANLAAIEGRGRATSN